MAPAIPAAMERPHFIGIGGAGMSGIAKILAQRGAKVAGSDARESGTAASLRALGATVHIGHAAHHLADDSSCVVVSSAIRADNPELARARQLGIPVVHRSDALAALMEGLRAIAVAGTHGKTTTTSMLAVALTELGLDPSYAIGGDLAGPGTNARHGEGDLFVAEADESDRSFQKYDPEVALVLNVELDHHANYASLEEVHESFEAFVAKVPDGGTLVVGEHPGARELAARVSGRPGLEVLRVGESEGSDAWIRRITPKGMTSEVTVVLDGAEHTFTVSVPGRHYAHNAAAALAAGARAGVDPAGLARALTAYTGVGRRLQLKGEAAGVQVVDSYAHHPTEMTADLEAMRDAAGTDRRLLVVFQPHLFSRTRELGAEMGRALALADESLVLDVYPAREDPIPGVTSALVTDAAAAAGARVTPVHDQAAVPGLIAGTARPGDLVLTMGAGDVTDLGPRILDRLAN
ncbi:UDP-N-acetylmuramate--L-alanine ligase [Streptomyces somaliensis DSM 40738]|uniref:UDP-N-acetylmuramate--L-alanine ligase n=1 Tax=Streptomyces somaliensis (strain ATCC 33201 / DSM 40738 / JCM 12659 / KCTC 9044 / NCTC 11332 / NRRL B-12077 / IP 733) TaxID=1134445 RepID=A0AA44DH21_STRE0|nr:UDP-N-acetylmuramate--L-alanine ligase [Streptomyces somaliensis]MCQ0025107.1 UDP-N-acetylmuramate--L-alanine ligase [Streptomyces somaliensis DSM 40738]NKY15986.1 UDP-N-acetylmuramate--L-alanine ligase [Streptomyces somaliensis DSM 40738]